MKGNGQHGLRRHQLQTPPPAFVRFLLLPMVVACVILHGCFLGSRVNVVTESDEYGDIQRTYTTGNLVVEKRSATGEFQYELFLNALRLDWRTGERYFYLVVRYNGRDWLWLEPGKPLVVVADGNRIVLPGEGSGAEDRSQAQDGTGAYFSEQARFELGPARLREIAAARSVSIQVPTKTHPLNLPLRTRTVKVLHKFVLRYLQ